MTYQVLWNGAKDHPGGRQLFAEEYVPQGTPPLQPPCVSDYLRAMKHVAVQWATAREIASACQLSIDQVNMAINSFLKQGEMEKEHPYAMRGRKGNQRYRWTKAFGSARAPRRSPDAASV